ncbi:family 16 glycosylhydrolase [Pseudoalteromonas mariniglutinosa]|uniref:family 16 glycosylhydrolase n=1 Tax=Pseudoalteromonas mariniglutinosa TaxID=206042 RepID=UPI00384FC970
MNMTTTKVSRLVAAISMAMLFGCGGNAETKSDLTKVDPQAPVSDWQMVWSDEFDDSSIDTNTWNYEVNCAGGGNNEKQCYTDSEQNAFIQDGILNIVALPAAEGAEKPYTSARLNTRYNADFTYGRFEMRAKLPSGQGSWPAFWMMPTDEVYGGWPRSGEIDILEAVNLKTPAEDGSIESNIHGTLHYGREWPNNASSGKAYEFPQDMNPADDFHTYAIEWQEGEIRWYVDDYLYATQRQSEVRTNANGDAVGLKHRGWFAEYFTQGDGELTTYWDSAPFDQDFYLILNLAVGGDWPENVNNLGIDETAFAEGQRFEIDYVRVYQCAANPDNGKGCETVRPGYDSLDDALVEGAAPVPAPPTAGVAKNLSVFDGTLDANWIAWDCCGGTVPEIISDADKGDVVKFNINDNNGTVLGFSTRGGHFPDNFTGTSTPFDASPLLELNGRLSFDMKVVTPPNAATTWLLKAEAGDGGPNTGDVALNESLEGADPVTGQWQTYTFPLALLQEKGLDLSIIDVLMVFPTWQTGEGAEYLITNVAIEGDLAASPEVDLFTDGQNLDWPMWDCCGGSTPVEAMDDEAHGLTAEFSIGEAPTVMGFNTRTSAGGSGKPFDATSILENGVLQFDVKVVSNPNNPEATWLMKIESNEGDTAVELPLTEVGDAPVAGEWKTYTFTFEDLAGAGLDVSAIDVVMIFPAWGTGEGAVYRVDNAKMYDPNASSASGSELTIFKDTAADQWSIWDCCGGSTPTEQADDSEHGTVAQFEIGATPTVMGFIADEGISFDASAILASGVVQFEMKMVSPPSAIDAQWLFKIESTGAASAVELPLSESVEGEVPVVGQWQTYTFTLQSLFDAGLDISDINVLMVFPAWGSGEGAVYRIDNVVIANP